MQASTPHTSNSLSNTDQSALLTENEAPNQSEPPEEIASNLLNSKVFVFPLFRRPLFPGITGAISVDSGPFYEALKEIIQSENRQIGITSVKDIAPLDESHLKIEDLHQIGVVAKIVRIAPSDSGSIEVHCLVESRAIFTEFEKEGGAIKALPLCIAEEKVTPSDEVKALCISLIRTIKELIKLNPLYKDELQTLDQHSDFTRPGQLADYGASFTAASKEEMQDILETFDVRTRLHKTLVLLRKELDLSILQTDLTEKIEAHISKTQKEFFLREQIQAIKKELGLDKYDKSRDAEKFVKRLEGKVIPEKIRATIQEELEKFETLEVHSPEYALCRNYLDWLTIIPWGVLSVDNESISNAEKILNKEHYGLEDIKQRILEFIGTNKLSQGSKGSILCLVGPPGVGKTSIGKSIAHALNRKFFRFSVGGMRDEAEIKGHRRTYIGAMPGKLIQALKQTQTMNPIILLDEVDKMGSTHYGDPASALLEVLDPEQNQEFSDHYLDVPCDLSHVMFIVTANQLDSIPEPLRDRMEILRLSGYILEEKLEIARKYLLPKNREQIGLKGSQISFSKAALREIIHGYAREAGVRKLEGEIKKILRKVALEIVKCTEMHQQVPKYSIKPEDIKKYLGKPIYTSECFYDSMPPGVCLGLAWTALGGAVLYIETLAADADRTSMHLTGQAGEVMKESSEIAWTYLKANYKKYAKDEKFFRKKDIHIHIPEGATPKDGPSAGVTMLTALISLLRNEPIQEKLGMTGELTLTGRVLAIGGVKEKLIAARRAGVKQIMFPKDNLRDYEELADYLKEDIQVHFVTYYDEIFSIAFPHASSKDGEKS